MKKKTTEEFVKESKLVHGNKYDYSKVEYINCDKKICIICPEHGEFWQTPLNHLSEKHGCPKCGYLKVSEKNSLTFESFILKSREVHGWKYDYSKVKYVNCKTKVCIICPEHGEFWQTPSEHLRGRGCHKCGAKKSAKKRALTNQEFIEKSIKIHGEKYDYSECKYKNNVTKVCIICPEHGKFYQKPNYHLSGNGCPSCNESHMEKEIVNLLSENGINFEREKTFSWLFYKQKLRLDFYLPDYNIAIECQGQHHFVPIDYNGKGDNFSKIEFEENKKRDKYKKELCEKNGVKLIYYANYNYKFPYEVIIDEKDLIKQIIT